MTLAELNIGDSFIYDDEEFTLKSLDYSMGNARAWFIDYEGDEWWLNLYEQVTKTPH